MISCSLDIQMIIREKSALLNLLERDVHVDGGWCRTEHLTLRSHIDLLMHIQFQLIIPDLDMKT